MDFDTLMKCGFSLHTQRTALFLASLALWFFQCASIQAAADLQGFDAGSTNWSGGPLRGWKELDFIPMRTVFSGGPATNQMITISFDHSKSGTIRGIENLTSFTPSSNVIITA